MVKLKKSKHKGRKHHRSKDRTYNRAVLTEEGIVIKSDINEAIINSARTSVSSLSGNRDFHARPSISSIDISTSTSPSSYKNSLELSRFNDNDTIFSIDDTPDSILGNFNETDFETSSMVSGATYLSDTYSISSTRASNDLPYSSLNGKFPINTVIPFSRILHAKYIERPSPRRSYESEIRSRRTSLSHINSAELTDSYKSGVNTTNGEYFYDASEYPIHPRDLDDKVGVSTNSETMRNTSKKLIEITFAKPRRHDIIPKRLTLDIETNLRIKDDIVTEILDRSYKGTIRNRNILIIINEHGGKGNAKKLYDSKAKPIFRASRYTIDLVYTEYTGHASLIAKEMDIHKYDTVVCASGDGIPYEVINGLYQRKDRVNAFNNISITQLPCGSANAMSVSCHWTNNVSYAALSIVKSKEVRMDIICCSQLSYINKLPKLSLLSQTYGLIAESDINTEFFRWIGAARFEIGVAFNILQKKKYPCDIYVKYAAKNKNELKEFYLAKKEPNHEWDNFKTELTDRESNFVPDESRNMNPVTEESFKMKYSLNEKIPDDWERIDPEFTKNLGIFYTGKMPYIAADIKFFPAALPNDGTIDMVLTDGRTAVTRMVPILLALDKGSHVLQPEVIHSKILAYRIVPKGDNTIFSVDGEKFPNEPLQAEVLPKLCKILLRSGNFVETEFEKM